MGVSFEDRQQDLLGHKSARITTHYSSAELTNLIKAANSVCGIEQGSMMTLLRSKSLVSENCGKTESLPRKLKVVGR